MKKLFSLKAKGLFWVEEEGCVYSVYDMNEKKHRFFDSGGNTLEGYARKPPKKLPAEVDAYEPEEDDEEDALVYNQYGVACAGDCLVDAQGDPLPGTELDFEVDCDQANRYFVFGRLTEEQKAAVDRCGTAEGVRVDYYDTKTRRYALRDIPEGRLDVVLFDGEPEVLAAATALLERYDTIKAMRSRTIVCFRDGEITVWEHSK